MVLVANGIGGSGGRRGRKPSGQSEGLAGGTPSIIIIVFRRSVAEPILRRAPYDYIPAILCYEMQTLTPWYIRSIVVF